MENVNLFTVKVRKQWKFIKFDNGFGIFRSCQYDLTSLVKMT